MSHLLDEVLAQAANGSPATAALSSESVAVLFLGARYLESRETWLDKEADQMDEVTDAQWDTIEKLVANAYYEIMNPIIGYCFPLVTALPANCLLLDGATYAREDYPALYAMLDSVYIIDADNFFVPDLRSRVPIGEGEGTGLSSYALNDTGGEETHELTEDENAAHTHIDAGHIHSEVAATPITIPPGEIPIPLPSASPLPTSTGIGFADIQPSGLGSGHNNIQPYVAVRWAVVAW